MALKVSEKDRGRLRALVEHEIHHRGQIYTLLGLIGVATPPLYGLTERQVFENSEQHGGSLSGDSSPADVT